MTGDADAQRGDGIWVSVRAVAWVLDEAPVPTEQFPTLMAIAANCDEHGRGSRQSKKTIAARTGKSPQQVGRDIASLLEDGLIKEGDQSLAAHLPAGQRPVVYDVVLGLKGPKPSKRSKNPSGVKKALTPTMEGTPTMDGTPAMDGVSTPTMEGQGGVPSMDPKQDFEKDLEEDFSSPYPSSPAESMPEGEQEEKLPKDDNPTGRLVDDLAAEYAAFRRSALAETVEACIADGRALDLIRAASRHCYADPATTSARRLVHDGPWWTRAAAELRADPQPARPYAASNHPFKPGPDRHPYQPNARVPGVCVVCDAPKSNARHRIESEE